ncbi:MAG TPA: response regulator [Desulfomonilaceae bacterium]|nr:response regulator [Desulfomonilaceae bacterium]
MSYRIVVADKDSRSQEAVTRFLGVADNEFVGVSTSGELKNAIKTRKPDLIILNSILADVPGWRLVRRIKESKEYSDVPVLLMTGDPEGPSQSEVKTAGADGYLSKPIQGQTLTSAVNSLLGLQDKPAPMDEEELTIEFEDDSGEMTEELLALSHADIEAEEPPTEMGDTVEIDTRTLVSELDSGAPDFAGPDTYGDTVKLNLDDMGLDTQIDEASVFEPTIELISDIPVDKTETPTVTSSEPATIQEPTAPDFSSVTRDLGEPEITVTDSMTVDVDVFDSGLKPDLEQPSATPAAAKTDTEHEYTDIENILEVRDPTKVITSEDLLLQDDSLIKGAVAESDLDEVDIIDLEEDTAIRDMEMEELEAIQTEDEQSVGLDLEETVPVESLDMEQIANEDLSGMIDLDYEEDTSLDVGVEGEPSLAMAEAPSEELTLEEVPYEEITTQEFFGEELPTEEFPAERLPEDKTGQIDMEREIVFDEAEGLDKGPFVHEPTLDAESAEEILFGGEGEEEPALEVTEDISLEEITLEEGPEQALPEEPEPPSVYEIPPPQVAAPEFAKPVPAPTVPEQPVGLGLVSEKPPRVEPSRAEPPAAGLAVAPSPEAQPPVDQIPDLKAAVPSREELLEGIASEISKNLPGREEIFERIDRLISQHLPSGEVMTERVDTAIKAALPSARIIGERLEKAIRELHKPEVVTRGFEEAVERFLSTSTIAERVDQVLSSIPEREEISRRFDQALSAMPSPKTVLDMVDQAVRGVASPEELSRRLSDSVASLLSSETLSAKFEEALRATPYQDFVKQSIAETLKGAISPEIVAERIDQALRGIPSQEYIRLRLDHAFSALPTPDIINQRIDFALQAIPSKDEIRDRLDKAFMDLPSAETMMARVDRAIETIPTRAEIMGRIEQAMESLPSPETVLSLLNRRLDSSIPGRDELSSEIRAMLEHRIQSAVSETQIQDAINRLLPDTEQILKTIRDALPSKERFQETLASGIVEAVQNSLPERIWVERVSRSLFDERSRGLLPNREEIVTLLREEIQSKMLDVVEKIIRQEIEKITTALPG